MKHRGEAHNFAVGVLSAAVILILGFLMGLVGYTVSRLQRPNVTAYNQNVIVQIWNADCGCYQKAFKAGDQWYSFDGMTPLAEINNGYDYALNENDSATVQGRGYQL